MRSDNSQKESFLKNPILSGALIAGVLLIPNLASAQTSSTPANGTAPAMTTMMMCRTAATGETASAEMIATKAKLVCSTVDLNGGPDISKAKTAEEVNAAWRAYMASGMQGDLARANAKKALDQSK
jgi:hypothetical protein